MLAHGWHEALQGLHEGVAIMLVISLAATLTLCVWAICYAWSSVRQTERRTRLAAMMVERGCKPELIERVVRATFGKVAPAEDPDPEVAIAKNLSDNSYESPDVQKILAAAREAKALDSAAVRLVRTMAENWADSDDIARVLRNRKGSASVSA